MTEDRRARWWSREPARDAQLAAALRAASGDQPLESTDWRALQQRIGVAVRRAALRARREEPWWSYAAAWARAAIPLALVAATAAIIVVARTPQPAGESVGGPVARAEGDFFTHFANGDPAREVVDSLLGRDADDWLLTASEPR